MILTNLSKRCIVDKVIEFNIDIFLFRVVEIVWIDEATATP